MKAEWKSAETTNGNLFAYRVGDQKRVKLYADRWDLIFLMVNIALSITQLLSCNLMVKIIEH